MFAKLTGTIDTIHTNTVILDVNGVGYLVACSARTIGQLGAPGTVARLLIETQVREDAISLFGFFDAEEQSWFKLLTTVQGVGARVAMNILGACDPGQLHMGIAAQDKAILTQADGVGPKLATRIVTELKDKVPEFSLGHVAPLPLKGRAGVKPAVEPVRADADAVSALINLGYGRAEAFAAVMQAKSALEQNNEPANNPSDLIRLSLKELGQS